MTPRDRHVRVSDVFASLYGTGYGAGAMEAECTLRRSIWRLAGRRVPRGSCVPQGSCVRSPARLSDNKSVCPTRESSRARVSGPARLVRAHARARVSGPVRPRELVCPGQFVRGPGSFVCPGQLVSCVRAGARARVSGPGWSCVRARLVVCPGPVRPCVRATRELVCPGQFVRVSGPAQELVCPSLVSEPGWSCVRARLVGDDAVWRSVGAERAGASRRAFARMG